MLGTLVVEVEADDGTVGFGVTTAGEPGAWIVERHLARFLEGAQVTDIEKIWDQMYRSTLFYGRKGLVLNVISAVDLALYDLLGRLRQEPVYQLLGGAVRDELTFYATGARPDLAQQMGFIGGKMAAAPCAARGSSRTAGQYGRARRDAGEGRRRLLADVGLLDVARPRLRHPAGHRGPRVRAEVAGGGVDPGRLLGLSRSAASSAARDAGVDRRARVDPATGSGCCWRWGVPTSCSPTSAGAAESPS